MSLWCPGLQTFKNELMTWLMFGYRKYIQFGIQSADDIRQASEVEITQRDLYTLEDHKPLEHGVLDTKMTCARVLLDEEEKRVFLKRLRTPGLDGLQIKDTIKKVNVQCVKATRCPHCDSVNGVVKKAAAMKIVHDKFRKKSVADEAEAFKKTMLNALKGVPELKAHMNKTFEEMTPLRVYRLFRMITADDCEVLGLDPQAGRPERLLWTAIPVPPVCIRPSVAQDGATNEDDLTVKLCEILMCNALIKTGIESGSQTSKIMEQWDFMSICVAMYIGSDVSSMSGAMNAKPIRGYTQRLKGKQGRFRGNLSGKRVDFSGRTVISPDPNMHIDEVAVPELVAKKLTYPDRVTKHNIEYLRQLIRNGPDVHPGANFVNITNEFKRSLKYGNRNDVAARLRVGDVVERHLKDGDIVLFNRQPSLHRLSIMAHKARVKPWRTFRFNECVCTPYNADFDGDEMNLHLPQTEEARMEAINLMGVKNNLVTPRNGEPIIGATQDFITTAYLITQKDRFYDRSQFVQICSYCFDADVKIDIPPPCIIKPRRLWSGKQIVNVLMRPNKKVAVRVNLETKTNSYMKPKSGEKRAPELCPADGWIIIRNSELLSGALDKSIVGDGKKNSIFFVVLRDYGTVEAAQIMNRLAKLSARWSCNEGFSIGLSDVMPGEVLRNRKDALIEDAYKLCDNLIAQRRAGKLENLPGCDEDQTLEVKISGLLSKVREDAGNVCLQELGRYNAPLIMATCKSKGSSLNVCQMVACVGQQIVNSNRISNGFTDRTLPHFKKHTMSPDAKGFVSDSFFTGLSPTEFLFHAVTGREGLVDTAVKTAETGYMQRRLVKGLEDLTAHYDLSVRGSTGDMIQFTYGGDALDPAELEGEGAPIVFDRNWLHSMECFPYSKSNSVLPPFYIKELVDKELAEPRFTKWCTPEWLDKMRSHINDHIVQRLGAFRKKYGMNPLLIRPKSVGKNTSPSKIIEIFDSKIDLSKRNVVNNLLCVTEERLMDFLNRSLKKYQRAMVEPGTAVGAVAAQSIGEPSTQMTLKTFHFAGIASMNVTMGVPRVKEIINASKNISTPIISAELEIPHSLYSARIVKGRVESTTLGDIAESITEVYTPHEAYLLVKLSVDTIRKLQLEVDISQICGAIAFAPRLKIKDANVRIDGYNKVRVYVPCKTESDLHFNMQNLKRSLSSIVIKGISSITRALISVREGSKSEVTGGDEYMLSAEGYGLLDVMTTEGIKGTKTYTNHIMEMRDVLGIEAARSIIIDEIFAIMSRYGISIDHRHLMLMADLMTAKGEVLGLTRFGISKMKDSVIMLASFEMTTEHLFNAAVYGRKDAIQGVSECIIMGTQMPIGTGLFKLLKQHDNKPPKSRPLLFDNPSCHVPLAAA
ncbi:DNA-directed RNA polymerase III subunit C1 (rpo31) [Mycoemilia scoparia]|uniref:DNA-directed RNA polymerase subunit n=1 Tax=Mycoemilia scoparia TaxID=417184 RepID=A0A9W8DW85_9FUNG|nr:DNA-directed RNA polymerase III subunit C1 (rpo31) [Mycoemilia scoparia]